MTTGAPPGAALPEPRRLQPGVAAALALAALAAGGVAGLAAVALPQPILVVAVPAALGLVALVVVNPDWALGTVAAFAVLNLANVATDYHGLPSLFQPLLALVAAGVAYRWVGRGERPVGGGRAAAFIAVYAAVAVASLLTAADFASGRLEVENLLKDAVIAVMAGLLLRRSSSLRRPIPPTGPPAAELSTRRDAASTSRAGSPRRGPASTRRRSAPVRSGDARTR